MIVQAHLKLRVSVRGGLLTVASFKEAIPTLYLTIDLGAMLNNVCFAESNNHRFFFEAQYH